MENENISALAAAKPRDHAKIRSELAAQIDAYPSFVRTAIYTKPVGKDDNGQMKYARGLSIRAAEAIAEAYGFCRIRADVSPIDDNTVKVEATFSDYQKGRIWQDGGLLSKFYKDRHGRMQRVPDDRFFNVTVKAEVSKRVREVILRSVPPGLRSELAEMVEARIDDLLDDATVAKIVANFAGKGVTREMLEAHIGRTMKAGWTKEDRKNLIGLWNALEQEETTVAEIVGEDNGKDSGYGNGNGKKQAPIHGAVTAGDLVGNGKQPLTDPKKNLASPPAKEKAPEGTAQLAQTESRPAEGRPCMQPGLYTCTACGWTGDKTARDGKCPKCRSNKVEATEDLAEPSQETIEISDPTAEDVKKAVENAAPAQGKCVSEHCPAGRAGKVVPWGDGTCTVCCRELKPA
jgi:predicted Zn-ribbon and HTH transcriptional regulator